MRDIDIGTSIGSMLPWSAIPAVGLPLAAWMTRRSGYAFWQVLPFRSVTIAGLKRTGITIDFAEPGWNPTTFLRHFSGKPSPAGTRTKLQDPLFFDDYDTCNELFDQILQGFEVTPIYHAIEKGRGGLVEVHSGLKKSTRDLAILARRDLSIRFVTDLKHLRSMDPVPWWDSSETMLEVLLPFTDLIHVQAINAEEWRNFIKGRPTKLAKMLQLIHGWGYAGPFVVEFDPRATGLSGLFPWILAENLRQIRKKVEKCLI